MDSLSLVRWKGKSGKGAPEKEAAQDKGSFNLPPDVQMGGTRGCEVCSPPATLRGAGQYPEPAEQTGRNSLAAWG